MCSSVCMVVKSNPSSVSQRGGGRAAYRHVHGGCSQVRHAHVSQQRVHGAQIEPILRVDARVLRHAARLVVVETTQELRCGEAWGEMVNERVRERTIDTQRERVRVARASSGTSILDTLGTLLPTSARFATNRPQRTSQSGWASVSTAHTRWVWAVRWVRTNLPLFSARSS
jgi:hypothetical protein